MTLPMLLQRDRHFCIAVAGEIDQPVVLVEAEKTEDWMIEISTSGPGDRLTILSHLNTITGTVDEAALAALLEGKI